MKFLYKLNYYYYKLQFNTRYILSQLFLSCAGGCAYGGGQKRIIRVVDPYGENVTYNFKNSLVQKNEAAIFDGTLIILNNMEILHYENGILENLVTKKNAPAETPGTVYTDTIGNCAEKNEIY